MTNEERDNAIRCIKKWSEENPYLQIYKTCLEALKLCQATDKRYTLTIVFDPKMENVLMVTHHKQGMLNYVGGHIEPGEDEMDASYRELYEETGITRDDTDLKFVQSEHCFASFANPEWYLYVTAGVLKHDVELKEEKNKLQWVSLQNMDAFLFQSFGDGNCYMFLRRALEALYINNNLEDQAYEDRD